jgi:hypothetical protein
MKMLLAGLLGLIAGVAVTLYVERNFFAAPPLPSNAFGRFVGALSPTWLNDGRKMRLNADFVFVDPNSKAWVARTGAEIDGASIPQSFWSLIGGPFEGKYRNASVVHDVACDERREPSDEVHEMFYFACRCAGVPERKAKAMYYAVANYGPQWKVVHEVRMLNGGGSVQASNAVDVVPPKKMTNKEAQAVMEYFEKNNPDLEAIATIEIDPAT